MVSNSDWNRRSATRCGRASILRFAGWHAAGSMGDAFLKITDPLLTESHTRLGGGAVKK